LIALLAIAKGNQIWFRFFARGICELHATPIMFCDIAGRTENEIKKVKLKLEISPTTHDPYTHQDYSQYKRHTQFSPLIPLAPRVVNTPQSCYNCYVPEI
jgi:hypothetical protein